MKSVKFWLLGMVSTVLAIAGFGYWGNLPLQATPPSLLAVQAAEFTEQGYKSFEVGNVESAFQNWRDAEALYLEMNHPEGVTGSRINQSVALQAMGQSVRACKVLFMTLNLEREGENSANPDLCTPQPEAEVDFSHLESSSVNAMGLRHFGNVLRTIGKPEISQFALVKSLEMARDLNAVLEIDAALLALGNTEEALYQKKLELWQRTDRASYRNSAIEHAQVALSVYQEVGEGKRNLANLNRLSFLWKLVESSPENLERKENYEAKVPDLPYSYDSSILPLAREIINTPAPFENLSKIEQIYARLTLARVLGQISSKNDVSTDFFSAALKAAEDAEQSANTLTGNLRVRSEVLGTLGYLSERSSNFVQARNYTQSALNLARIIPASDLVYQWAWQQARIDRATGDIESAIDAYQTAIDSLDTVRKDLLNLNSEWLFSYQDRVQPLYEEAIDLLLRSPQPSQANLQRAIRVSDRFQTAELENFLKCNLVSSEELNLSNLKAETVFDSPKLDASVATIRIIVLEKFNRAIEIVQSQNSELFYHEISGENWQETLQEISALRTRLNSNTLRTTDARVWIQPRTQAIYQKLIAPIQSALPDRGTLVFILDSRLQSIPMTMLQDENGDYLIERYQIALNFPTQVYQSSTKSRQENWVFAAGLAIRGESFARVSSTLKELENVDNELKAIQEVTDASSILRDRDFTVEKFAQRVQRIDFPIVHIATHGQFSSVPEETFILAYDRPININQLESLLRDRTEGTRQSLELLVLSACQTAKDDKRGGLGLAGVSLRAGAKSTVASLWNISDRSTADFVKEFYLALKQSHVSKAEALRQAQLKFITDPQYTELGYDRPYYWAAFVLLGNVN